MRLSRFTRGLAGLSAGVGLAAAAFLSATPAFAAVTDNPAACIAAGNQVRISATDAALSPAVPGSGLPPFTGNATVTVECVTPAQVSLGVITDAQIVLTATPEPAYAGTTFSLSSPECVPGTTPPATSPPPSPPGGNPGNPIACNLGSDGHLTFNVTSPNLNTAGAIGIQVVGSYSSSGGNIAPRVDVRLITAPGGVTPELSSVALFGSGALGMAGFAFARLRAKRRERDA